jgi:tetratricopeptide (TPR) repeat protein
LTALARSRYDQGRYDLAEEDARKALKIVEKLPQSTHYYAGVYSVLGLTLNKTGRSREAEPLLREVLAIRQKAAKRSVYVAAALGDLGECLTTQQRYREAQPLLAESYEMLKTLQIPQSPSLELAVERLAALHSARASPGK